MSDLTLGLTSALECLVSLAFLPLVPKDLELIYSSIEADAELPKVRTLPDTFPSV